jgi:hypothetical protein
MKRVVLKYRTPVFIKIPTKRKRVKLLKLYHFWLLFQRFPKRNLARTHSPDRILVVFASSSRKKIGHIFSHS